LTHQNSFILGKYVCELLAACEDSMLGNVFLSLKLIII